MAILHIPSSESVNWRPSLCAEDKQQFFVSSSFAQRMQYVLCEITYSLQNSMSLYAWDTLIGSNCQNGETLLHNFKERNKALWIIFL